MALWQVKAVIKRRNYFPVTGCKQPRPIFFSEEDVERMNRQEGSYQYKGGHDGKEIKTDGH